MGKTVLGMVEAMWGGGKRDFVAKLGGKFVGKTVLGMVLVAGGRMVVGCGEEGSESLEGCVE